MKKVLQQMVSIAMALLLLVSTTSWKVEKHYCMGHLVDVALFVPAEKCGMNMQTAANTEQEEQEKKSCCDDEVLVVEGQDDFHFSYDDISLHQEFFIITFGYAYIKLLEKTEKQSVLGEYYPPPILVKDIQVLDQVFLI